MEYTKNTNPHYYEENQNCSNCGSFAFQIEEWYSPDEYFEEDMGVSVEEWIDNRIWNGWDEYDMSDEFAGILVNYILNDFDDVRYIVQISELEQNEELIAFRTFVTTDGNWDFHFKVLRNGMWLEKCGSDPTRFCEKDDWHNGLMEYISYTSYFARKLTN